MVDFFLRRPESNDESFELATAETINKLSSFFSFPAESEVAKIELLLKLEDKLRPHKYKNLNEFLFVSKPVIFIFRKKNLIIGIERAAILLISLFLFPYDKIAIFYFNVIVFIIRVVLGNISLTRFLSK